MRLNRFGLILSLSKGEATHQVGRCVLRQAQHEACLYNRLDPIAL